MFLLFLFLGLYYENNLFLIFDFICCVIIIYELVNTGIEYPIGENITITKINGSDTVIGSTDRYEKLNSFWVNSLIAIFAIIALGLIWQAVIGFEEND